MGRGTRCCFLGRTIWSSELQFPDLGNQILSSPTLVRLLRDPPEAGLFVEMASGVKFILGPEKDFLVAGTAGEFYALGNQALANAKAAAVGLDEKQAQLGDGLRVLHEEDRAEALSVFLGDPAALAPGIEVLDELRHDFSDQGLEALVVAVFRPVQFAVALDDPAHVSGAVGAEGYEMFWDVFLSSIIVARRETWVDEELFAAATGVRLGSDYQ